MTAPARITRDTLTENRLEEYLRRRVRGGLGGMLEKLQGQGRGMPDRMVLLPGGRIFLVELKTSTGRTSALQDHWHERAEALGTRVVVLHGVAEIDAWVREVAESGLPRHLRTPGPGGARRKQAVHTRAHDVVETTTFDRSYRTFECVSPGCGWVGSEEKEDPR